MLKFVAALSLFAIVSSNPVHLISGSPSAGIAKVPMLDGRIVGGLSANITDYPWQLSLRKRSTHNCGASIISATWALSAAHCVEGVNISTLTFRAGSSFHRYDGVIHDISSVYIHDSFISSTLDYDVAVLEVSSPFALGTPGINTVALSTSDPSPGETLYVTGWGTMYDGGAGLPSQLRAVDVPIVDRSSCKSSYEDIQEVTERMICAGYENRDACLGDSGGPLVSESTQYGIVSWGYGCAIAGYPGVYISVASVRSWITSATGV